MPMLGFGTYQLEEGNPCIAAVRDALDVGYRHVDTAAIYQNEQSVGRAIDEFGDREKSF